MRQVAIFLLAVLLASGASGSLWAAEKARPPPEANTAVLKANWGYVEGTKYAEGRGVAQNLEIAEKYFEAAFAGDPDYAVSIGITYSRKLKQFAKASHWFERGVAVGAKDAVEFLGFLYEDVKQHPLPDHAEFQRMLQSDDGYSATRLGRMYLFGWDVTRDPVEAEKWFRKALRKGHLRVLADLADYTSYGWMGNHDTGVTALAWYLTAAHFGDDRARKEALKLSAQTLQDMSLLSRRQSRRLLETLKAFDGNLFPFPSYPEQ
jgi:TPR repeat protein